MADGTITMYAKKSSSLKGTGFFVLCTAAFAVKNDKKVLNHHSSKWVFAEAFLPVLLVI